MSTRVFSPRLLAVLGIALALAGCTDNPFAVIPPVPPSFAAPPPLASGTGGLFNAASFAPLVADNRARQIGDLLTIRLVERMQSRKSATADATRDSKTDITLPRIDPLTHIAAGALNGGMSQSFKGAGTAAQDNLLSGEITVTVAQVLAGGVLLVQGEKRLMLNRGEEQVQLSGMVRAADIGADNSVASTRVANAQIRYGGTGQIADASRQGWLARFFTKVTPL